MPCAAGQFFIDRLPVRYTQVQLGHIHYLDAVGQVRPIDSGDTLAFDLQP